jgi:hypothetical protein
MTLGLEMELLVPQLRELVDECSVKVESGGLPPAGTCGGAVSVAEEACGGTRRHRGSQKRAQGKDEHRRDVVVEDEHGAAGSNLQPRCSKRRYTCTCASDSLDRVSILWSCSDRDL